MTRISSAQVETVSDTVKEFLCEDIDIANHVERVCCICVQITNCLDLPDKTIDTELLYKAAWLHDIGKVKFASKTHHLGSAIMLTWLLDCGGDESNMQYAKKMQSIIIAHKKDFKPLSEIAIEAAILCIADKIDKYNKRGFLEADKSYEKSLKKVEFYFAREEIGHFEQLKSACESVRNSVKKEAEDSNDDT